jgi:UTP--glucose-1-phosphate uridylyltransferase
LGTRFLPVTKAVPKELLPLFDKPLIQFAVEEAVSSGIEEIILVTSEDKEPLERYFQPHPQLEESIRGKVSPDMLKQVKRLGKLARVSCVRQEQPLGLGHAVLMAKERVGDEAFAVILPDDVIFHRTPALAQLLEVYRRRGAGVIAVEEVPPEGVSSYGVIDPDPLSEGEYRIRGLVEKPPQEEAPSNLAIVGRYILPPAIFQALERTKPGAKGEIQLTDGLALLLESHQLFAYRFDGERHDGGTPIGLLKASIARARSISEHQNAFLDSVAVHTHP